MKQRGVVITNITQIIQTRQIKNPARKLLQDQAEKDFRKKMNFKTKQIYRGMQQATEFIKHLDSIFGTFTELFQNALQMYRMRGLIPFE